MRHNNYIVPHTEVVHLHTAPIMLSLSFGGDDMGIGSAEVRGQLVGNIEDEWEWEDE